MKRTPCSPAAGRPWRRREFLRTGGLAALVAGGARLAGATPFLGPGQAGPGKPFDAAIIGGGIAGLTAAYYLRDLRILLLEKEARAGGRVRPAAIRGGSVSQTFYIGKPYGALKEIIETLGLETVEIPAPMAAAFRDDQYYFGPDGLARLLAERSRPADFDRFKDEVLAVAADYQDIPELDLTTPSARLDDLTARQWFAERKFPPVFAELYGVIARNRFGASLDDISGLALIPEIAFGLGGATGDAAAPEVGTGAFTFEGGLSAVTDALAGGLGDKIVPRAQVVRVSKPGADYLVEYADASGRIVPVRAKFVVLAIPAPAALAVAAGVLKPEARSLLESIPYAACAVTALMTREPLFGRAFELFLPDGGMVTGFRETAWIFRSRAAGAVVVQAAPARLGEAGWPALTDEEIAKAAIRAVSRVFPGLPSRIVSREVVRFPQAHPVLVPGAFKRLARLNEISDGRVLLAGDHMIYPDFEAAADAGDFAAEKIGELF